MIEIKPNTLISVWRVNPDLENDAIHNSPYTVGQGCPCTCIYNFNQLIDMLTSENFIYFDKNVKKLFRDIKVNTIEPFKMVINKCVDNGLFKEYPYSNLSFYRYAVSHNNPVTFHVMINPNQFELK